MTNGQARLRYLGNACERFKSITNRDQQKNRAVTFAVRDRVEKLFDAGVILGPTIVAHPAQVGMNRTVFFEFKTNPHEPWLAKMLERTSSCDLLDGTTGEFSLLARFRLAGDEHFGIVLKKIDDALGRSYFKKYES